MLEPWICKVQVAPTEPPQHVPQDRDPNEYYRGAQPIAFAIGGSDTSYLEHILSRQSAFPLPKFAYTNGASFVKHVLADPRALVMKTAFARKLDSTYIILGLHVIDLDAEGVDKHQLRQFLHDRPLCSIRELLDTFPPYRLCFEQAMRLANGNGHCISTGMKGFRVLLTNNASSLYVCAERASVKGSMSMVKQLVEPALQRYFDLEHLPPCIDFSVFGENKGVRTNLHPHPGTGLWPLLVTGQDQPYGSFERDARTAEVISSFWEGYVDGVPVEFDGGRDLFAVGAQHQQQLVLKQKVQNNKRPLPRSEMEELVDLAIVRPTKQVNDKQESDNEEDNSVIQDSFADIAKILQTKQWVPHEGSLQRLTKGCTKATVLVKKRESEPFLCPRTGRVHANNTFVVRIDRVIREITPMCLDPECKDTNFAWPTEYVGPVGGGGGALCRILIESKMQNHLEIARLIAPSVRSTLAYCGGNKNWRFYENGTWRLSLSHSKPQTLIGNVLAEAIKDLVAEAKVIQRDLPLKSEAMKKSIETVTQLLSFVHHAGNRSFLMHLTSMLEPFCEVDDEKWDSYFSGYLPVKNCLLKFCVTSGAVIPLEYRPDMFVRYEYQAQITWDSTAPAHAGLDNLFNDWWDETERPAMLQVTVYALSRTGILEVMIWMWGPPSSAKSSFMNLLRSWFGPNNVFVHTSPALIVQKKGTRAHDDDGKGHDSSLMACFNKAMVSFPEPDSDTILRDAAVKRMTGDTQAGREAHSKTVETCKRTYTPVSPCNFIPWPMNPSDIAIRRRTYVATSHRVFFTSEAHKQEVMSRMSEEQLKHAHPVEADPTKVPAVQNDPTAATHFLNLLAREWRTFIVNQNRKFVPSELATKVLDRFWSNFKLDQDSIVAFLSTQVEFRAGAYLPKKNLWLAYNAWYSWTSRINGAPGVWIKSEHAFKTRVTKHYSFNNDVNPNATSEQYVLRLADESNVNSNISVPDKKTAAQCYSSLGLILPAPYLIGIAFPVE